MVKTTYRKVGDESRVLFVEHDVGLGNALTKVLTLRGYRVWHERDGAAALLAVRREKPNLVVMSSRLPGDLSGLDVLVRLRQDHGPPVLLVTALTDVEHRTRGLELGAAGSLTRPFGVNDLVSRVASLLRAGPNPGRAPTMLNPPDSLGRYRYGPLMLSPARNKLRVRDLQLHLSRDEIQLMSALMANPGRIQRREDLIEALWGAGYTGSARAVDNIVVRLKQKLGVYSNAVETIWGTGYRLATMHSGRRAVNA